MCTQIGGGTLHTSVSLVPPLIFCPCVGVSAACVEGQRLLHVYMHTRIRTQNRYQLTVSLLLLQVILQIYRTQLSVTPVRWRRQEHAMMMKWVDPVLLLADTWCMVISAVHRLCTLLQRHGLCIHPSHNTRHPHCPPFFKQSRDLCTTRNHANGLALVYLSDLHIMQRTIQEQAECHREEWHSVLANRPLQQSRLQTRQLSLETFRAHAAGRLQIPPQTVINWCGVCLP